ncbi:hypothetical protein IP78_06525 [Brevundimonas sp. AAP58]|nr:hypothetical protein IP78_06525 [Brevundimonas sp. AAP58]
MMRHLVFGLAAFFLSAVVASECLAQIPSGPDDPRQRTVQIYGPGQLGTAAGSATRLDRLRRELDRGRPSNVVRDPLPVDPVDIRRGAQTAMNRARTGCQVNDAAVLGYSLDNDFVYEAACENGQGYLVVASMRPTVVECGTALDGADSPERDVDAIVISQCVLPANQPALERVSAFARQAGVPCQVDQVAQVGAADSGTLYEVGCADGAGYWLRQEQGAWQRISCLKVAGLDGACTFTTPSESYRSLSARFADTAASGCEVVNAAYVGSASALDYVEVQCGTGTGFMVEIDREERVSNAWSCAVAQRVAGGCRLTGASQS